MLTANPGNHEPRQQAGFTLIEVLIAVLLLSVGLLGLAGLQTASLRNNGSALLRSQATTIAYDILDQMRADVSPANPDYSPYETSGLTCNSSASTALSDWQQELCQLPGGEGSIAVTGNNVTVTVKWLEKWDPNLDKTNPDSRYQQISFKTQL